MVYLFILKSDPGRASKHRDDFGVHQISRNIDDRCHANDRRILENRRVNPHQNAAGGIPGDRRTGQPRFRGGILSSGHAADLAGRTAAGVPAAGSRFCCGRLAVCRGRFSVHRERSYSGIPEFMDLPVELPGKTDYSIITYDLRSLIANYDELEAQVARMGLEGSLIEDRRATSK